MQADSAAVGAADDAQSLTELTGGRRVDGSDSRACLGGNSGRGSKVAQDEASVVATAARHGLAVEGLDAYRHGEAQQAPALVVGYGTPPDHAYSGALARLTAALTAAPQ